MLKKLECYGIRGTALNLIKSYLTGRSQFCEYQETDSTSSSICYGVLQGSVLGPLLFLLYINDIINCSKDAEFVLFADDTNIFVTASSLKEVYRKANEVLASVEKYMFCNQLHINAAKSNHMYFNPGKTVSEGGLSLLVPHQRYLAVFGGIGRYWAVLGGIGRYWAVLGGIGRYWAVLGGIGRYWAVLGGIGRYWAVLGGIGRYWAVLGGIGRYWAVFGICVFYASC